VTPAGLGTRPTLDRVRESLFNALGSLDVVVGAETLDLFAGSGALGIEALSRGAASCTFVDVDRAAREAVEANLRSTGFTALATVVGGDALVWLDRPGTTTRFDLVLCDPPYAFTDAQWTELFAALVPHVGRVDGGPGVVVVESDRSVPLPKGWHPLRTKAYGDTIVLVLQPPDGPRTDGRRA
jgi:16S rRNA (guanine966-N2)-methyltransferase